MKSLFSIFISLLLCKSTSAQESNLGNWFIYFGNQKISGKLNWHNEIQYRNYNIAGDLQQLLLRTGAGINLSEKNNNILLGYGFIHSQNYLSNQDDKKTINEHRIFQQFITRQNFGRFYLQHRLRMEERFFTNDLQLRFRYFLGSNVTLNKETMADKTLYLSVYNEVFMHSQNALFDRNRLYGAIGYAVNNDFRVEIGFMAQTLANTNRNQFQIVIFNNIPFIKN